MNDSPFNLKYLNFVVTNVNMDHTSAAPIIQAMITLRKKVPPFIIETHNKLTKQQLDCLNKIKVNLNSPEINCDIPDDVLEKLNTEHNNYLFNRNLYEQLILLEIMKSKNSPISSKIDAI